MAHTIEDHDGLQVLVVSDMNRRFHPDSGVELPTRRVNDKLVSGREISRHYGVPYQTIGIGDDRVQGVWELIHENVIGLRVPYNTETVKPTDMTIHEWQPVKDATGKVLERKHVPQNYTKFPSTQAYAGHPQGGQPLTVETDEGMYVRLSDLLLYADAQGWEKGKGRPKKASELPMGGLDIAAIVAAATQATIQALAPLLGVATAGPSLLREPVQLEPAEPKVRSLKARANDAWIGAGRPQPADEWKANWQVHNA